MKYIYQERKKILTDLVHSSDIVNLIISYIPKPKFDRWCFKLVCEDIRNHKYCMRYELYDDESMIDKVQYISNFLRDTRQYFFYNNSDDDDDDGYEEIFY